MTPPTLAAQTAETPTLLHAPAVTPDTTRAHLAERLDPAYLNWRLSTEASFEAWAKRQRQKRYKKFTDWLISPKVIRTSLKLVGMHERAQRNALNIQVKRNVLTVRNLPRTFENARILHLSDLHADMNEALVPALLATLQRLDVEYDYCVLTGDYRYQLHGTLVPALAGLNRLAPVLSNAYGILGNHDSIQLVAPMEYAGIRMLMNESVELTRNGESLWLLGVDDPHQHRRENLARARQGVPSDGATLLLAHNPEFYSLAAKAGVGAMLSGHTHGGQICLPGGIPILYDARCPRNLAVGSWKYQNLNGYTSVGAGSSVADVRLNCRPEIAIHTLTAG